jgi:diacylglycerol kinase (ATP)
VKPVVIFNPHAGSVVNTQDILTNFKKLKPQTILITKKRGDAEKWTRRLVRDGQIDIIAAGGDGTLNEVVNGAATARHRLRIGIIPLGTGNDFARTLSLPASVDDNIEIVRAGKSRALDIVRVRGDRTRYFANVAAGGFSGLVRRKMTAQIKRSWGPFAYIRGAAAALPKLHAYKTRIVIDNEEKFSLALYNVVIANGRYVAGGLHIAPEADPADGLLDVVLIPKQTAPELALLAAQVVLGTHFSSNLVITRRAKKLSVRSRPGMWFNVDGELVGSAPAEFQILPSALDFVVT